jgi:LmbE family N-acetylglucosaminyl deacetylase
VSNRRLLISLAHPDDESFGHGGLITRYVAEGVDVYYVCATNGDVGTVSPEMLNGYSSVAELRLAELDCASEILGFKQVFKLGYKDSGMMNSETSKDPACLWQAPREAVARRVVEVIRKVKPQVVITFNKYGGYGHPDHIAIQRATVDAFNLAGDPNYFTDGQTPYQPQKLYYGAFPKFMMRYRIMRIHFRGENPRRMGRNREIDLQAILDNAEPVHTRIDVSNYLEAWDKASACHTSQLVGRGQQMPMFLRKMFFSKQGLTRVIPAPQRNVVDENDLFVGVRLDEPVGVR